MAKSVEWRQRERVRKIHANRSRLPKGGDSLCQGEREREKESRETYANVLRQPNRRRQSVSVGASRPLSSDAARWADNGLLW